MNKIRVLIVDDHPVVRQGLLSLLSNHEDIEVVAEASNGAVAIEQAAALSPDVVLLDIRMPGSTGIEATRQLRRMCPEVKVIILTAYDDDEYLVGAIQAGAHGYLLKTASHESLAEAIRRVHAGQRLLSPSLVNVLLERFEALAKEQVRAESGLSESELQLLSYMAEGATNRTIAGRLYLSEVTVKRKVQGIFAKLGVSSRAQAVAEAIRRGLI